MSTNKPNDRFENYIPVAERVEQFYAKYPNGRIITSIEQLDHESGFVLIRAAVYRQSDDVDPSATGHAYEVRGEGYVNKTSFIENCETGAVGRALAMLGFEVQRGIASREEMQKTERMRPVAVVTAPPEEKVTYQKTPQLKSTPKQPEPGQTEHGKLNREIMIALDILGRTEDQFNEWVARQFQFDGDWTDLLYAQKMAAYNTLKAKVDAKASEI